MVRLEDLRVGMLLNGLVPGRSVKVVHVQLMGSEARLLVYLDGNESGTQQVYRSSEAGLEVANSNLPWTFEAPAAAFKLALEATRIKLGHLFDPMMAIHSSNVIPLPHQISAVYENMLPKQPLRYVLADDPGAGKTIMAGLLIKELSMRGDAKRILIVSPGSLVEQWQSELADKFSLDFKIFSREAQEQSSTGNFFLEEDFVVARIDQLSRIDDFREKLAKSEWDLVIVDEAHKMAAHYFGSEVKKSLRYELGELLGRISRHLLLMTATPHNGHPEDFQLWLQLLDPDRFFGVKGEEGEDIHVDESIMRRLVKEKLLKFDGTRLFPMRTASTIPYELPPEEQELYDAVTTYVVEEMNKADRLSNKAKNCVGFALTMLQRRLASSPEAIFQSLKRRHERLLQRIDDIEAGRAQVQTNVPDFEEDFDEDDYTPEELERLGTRILDSQTAARSLSDLRAEVATLGRLVAQAKDILDHDLDSKWRRLVELLQSPELVDQNGNRQKIIIFTEHKDTLNYLEARIRMALGDYDAVTAIHGGTNRERRRQIQEEFNNNQKVTVLLATDAAGEGVNLHQSCHLMINYDMPWNPSRLEQRFGRIHRIGQTQPCQLWNLIAAGTREGQVFERLLQKLREENEALGGEVYDILGSIFEEVSLKDMLLKAIREGNSEEARNWMKVKIDSVFNTEHLQAILRQNSITDDVMTTEKLFKIKEDMEKAEARKLQPCFVQNFFAEGLRQFGGDLRPRQRGRFEIPRVPPRIISTAKALNPRNPVATHYDAVCFDKGAIHKEGQPSAKFLHAGHPLVAAVTELVLEENASLLKPGTVMVDPSEEATEPSLLFFVDHSVVAGEDKHLLSRRPQFVRMTKSGVFSKAGWAPHLDLETPSEAALQIAAQIKTEPWLREDLELKATVYATEQLVSAHFEEVKARQLDKLDRINQGIRTQLVKAINFYNRKYMGFMAEARLPEAQPVKLASAENMRRKAEELTNRLRERERALSDERNIISLPPIVKGGILVIPKSMLGPTPPTPAQTAADAEARRRVELLAMQAVIAKEEAMGNTCRDVSADKCGWDITSSYPEPAEGQERKNDRHIEVKGRVVGATTVTMTRNEICYAINQSDKFILALVMIDGDQAQEPIYIRNVWENQLNFGVAKEDYQIADLLTRAERPEDTL